MEDYKPAAGAEAEDILRLGWERLHWYARPCSMPPGIARRGTLTALTPIIFPDPNPICLWKHCFRCWTVRCHWHFVPVTSSKRWLSPKSSRSSRSTPGSRVTASSTSNSNRSQRPDRPSSCRSTSPRHRPSMASAATPESPSGPSNCGRRHRRTPSVFVAQVFPSPSPPADSILHPTLLPGWLPPSSVGYRQM